MNLDQHKGQWKKLFLLGIKHCGVSITAKLGPVAYYLSFIFCIYINVSYLYTVPLSTGTALKDEATFRTEKNNNIINIEILYFAHWHNAAYSHLSTGLYKIIYAGQ